MSVDQQDGKNFIKRKVSNILDTLSNSPTEADFSVTYCDIFWIIISILGRIISILININVAYAYYKNDKIYYFILTVSCFAIPMIVTTLLQIAM